MDSGGAAETDVLGQHLEKIKNFLTNTSHGVPVGETGRSLLAKVAKGLKVPQKKKGRKSTAMILAEDCLKGFENKDEREMRALATLLEPDVATFFAQDPIGSSSFSSREKPHEISTANVGSQDVVAASQKGLEALHASSSVRFTRHDLKQDKLLVLPGKNFDSKLLVPKTCIDTLLRQNLIEETSLETCASGHFSWRTGIEIEQQCEALLLALEEGPRKKAIQNRLASVGSQLSVAENPGDPQPSVVSDKPNSGGQLGPQPEIQQTRGSKRSFANPPQDLERNVRQKHILHQLQEAALKTQNIDRSTFVTESSLSADPFTKIAPYWWTKNVFEHLTRIRQLRENHAELCDPTEWQRLIKRLVCSSQKPYRADYLPNGMAADKAWRKAANLQLRVRVKVADGPKEGTLLRLSAPDFHYDMSLAVCEQVSQLLTAANASVDSKQNIISFPTDVNIFLNQCKQASFIDGFPFNTKMPRILFSKQKPFRFLRHLAALELAELPYTELPFESDQLCELICKRRQEVRAAGLQTCDPDAVSNILLAYVQKESNAFANSRFIKFHSHDPSLHYEMLQCLVRKAFERFEHYDSLLCSEPRTVAVLCLLHHFLDDNKMILPFSKWTPILCPKERFILTDAGSCKPKLAMHSTPPLPPHVNQPTEAESQELKQRAILTGPVVCQLCHETFGGMDCLAQHCRKCHGGWKEYRKQVFFRAEKHGVEPVAWWMKRAMIQSFAFFQTHSVPSSCNDWSSRTLDAAVPRREEACAVCATKDFLENRFEAYMFDSSSSTTTLRKYWYVGSDADQQASHLADEGNSLFYKNGKFCFAPKEKVHPLLNVEKYILLRCRIPAEELHGSSVQHPDDPSMRWLVHSRRVPKEPLTMSEDSRPMCAGVGLKDETCWLCKECLLHLCSAKHVAMPPLALSNLNFLGREHVAFRNYL